MIDHFQTFSALNFKLNAHYTFQTEDTWGTVTNYDDYLLLIVYGWEKGKLTEYIIWKTGLKLQKVE